MSANAYNNITRRNWQNNSASNKVNISNIINKGEFTERSINLYDIPDSIKEFKENPLNININVKCDLYPKVPGVEEVKVTSCVYPEVPEIKNITTEANVIKNNDINYNLYPEVPEISEVMESVQTRDINEFIEGDCTCDTSDIDVQTTVNTSDIDVQTTVNTSDIDVQTDKRDLTINSNTDFSKDTPLPDLTINSNTDFSKDTPLPDLTINSNTDFSKDTPLPDLTINSNTDFSKDTPLPDLTINSNTDFSKDTPLPDLTINSNTDFSKDTPLPDLTINSNTDFSKDTPLPDLTINSNTDFSKGITDIKLEQYNSNVDNIISISPEVDDDEEIVEYEIEYEIIEEDIPTTKIVGDSIEQQNNQDSTTKIVESSPTPTPNTPPPPQTPIKLSSHQTQSLSIENSTISSPIPIQPPIINDSHIPPQPITQKTTQIIKNNNYTLCDKTFNSCIVKNYNPYMVGTFCSLTGRNIKNRFNPNEYIIEVEQTNKLNEKVIGIISSKNSFISSGTTMIKVINGKYTVGDIIAPTSNGYGKLASSRKLKRIKKYNIIKPKIISVSTDLSNAILCLI